MAGHISDEDSENITREDPSMQGPMGSRSVVESGHPSIRNIMTGMNSFLLSGGSDKLGMRCTGHITVRSQPLEDYSDYSLE
ncbi:hypothetical protein RDI58_010934 [Solanum bulbocastanum]|uniref:Uncharacterized protein n=1 Tax=Solanum bulbocastanum TaxID=147425 RepID=A0AAN8TNU7_SOLBU